MQSYMRQRTSRKNQDGVVLVIVPIIMLLLGLLVAYMTRSVGGPNFYKDQETHAKMDEITIAMSSYVQRYNRLPCPAQPDNSGPEPFGYEEGSGANGGNIPAGICAASEGIVPVYTLGLAHEYLKDAWGNYFTYVVSRDFTVPATVGRYDSSDASPPAGTDRLPMASGAANMQVHNLCRSSGAPGSGSWIEMGRANYVAKNGTTYTIQGGPVDVAINPFKARFCCAEPTAAGDIIVNVNGVNTPTRDAAGGDYASADTTGLGAGTAAETAVFVLISHGANSSGNFLVNNTNNKRATPAAVYGLNEIENRDGDNNYNDLPQVLGDSAANYYDDIVVHLTQNQLYGYLGHVDCSSPY